MDKTQFLKDSQVQGQQEITREKNISCIRPLLEYSDSVWDNCSSDSKKQLEAIHTEAARIIVGATELCSIEKLLSALGWETLQSRHNKHKLVLLYKILYGLVPDHLSELVPPSPPPPLFKKLLHITSEILTMFKTIEPIQTSFLAHSFLYQFVHGTIYLMIYETHLLLPPSSTN